MSVWKQLNRPFTGIFHCEGKNKVVFQDGQWQPSLPCSRAECRCWKGRLELVTGAASMRCIHEVHPCCSAGLWRSFHSVTGPFRHRFKCVGLSHAAPPSTQLTRVLPSPLLPHGSPPPTLTRFFAHLKGGSGFQILHPTNYSENYSQFQLQLLTIVRREGKFEVYREILWPQRFVLHLPKKKKTKNKKAKPKDCECILSCSFQNRTYD